MNLIRKFFEGDGVLKAEAAPRRGASAAMRLAYEREIARPLVASANFMSLYLSVPEVAFPVNFIASRIAKAHFEIKRMKDDSVVWCNRRMDRIFANPNCLMGWSELVETHFVYKLATGNGFMRAMAPESLLTPTARLYKCCDHFWPLPSPNVFAIPASNSLPLFGICGRDEIVKEYRLQMPGQQIMSIPACQIWHDRDGIACYSAERGKFLKAPSRLLSVMKPISNLMAVYEARNVIYVKRGGIGFLVSLKRDETGSTAMDPKEKKEIQDYLTSTYGIGEGQIPIGLSDVPMSFLRTNLSIAELQPFEETLEDAVKIAGAYGIPDVLVPRKDHSTFSNQSTAEKSAYCGVIIPMAKQFCNDLTIFLGLDKDGLYLDCNFSDVDCLQVGLKESEEVKKLVNDRCRQQFCDGLITLNDWRAQIHESQIPEEEDALFSKLKFQMGDDELARVAKIIGNQSTNQTSIGESNHERENEESEFADQG